MQRTKIIKYIKIFASILFVLIIAVAIFFYQKIKTRPQLSVIAQHIGTPAAAFAFNFSRNLDRQIYYFSKNLGLENNPRTQQKTPPPAGDIGAQGFFIVDLKPQFSEKFFSNLDSVLNNFLDFLDAEISFEYTDQLDSKVSSIYEEKDNEPKVKAGDDKTDHDNAGFEKPLTALLDEFWNGPMFVIGGASQLQLAPKDAVLLASEAFFKNIMHLPIKSSSNLILKNIPVSLQNFFDDHSMKVAINTLSFDPITRINHSQISFSVLNPNVFVNSICAVEVNPWDFCGRFSFAREKFRNNIYNVLSLLNSDFKISFDIYWATMGSVFVFSNQKAFLNTMLDPNTQTSSDNILKSVSASGDDFLLPTYTAQKYSHAAFLFDMIHLQNEMINFVEHMRNQSAIMSDYFSSPAGDMMFTNIESKIGLVTGYSEKGSISLDTDGEVLLPEIRLYAPSGDIFVNNGKNLHPSLVNSLRVFITKIISFGNYLLPRGLVPIPEPYIEHNGKWVIIRSEIPIKSIAPYLESPDPYANNPNVTHM